MSIVFAIVHDRGDQEAAIHGRTSQILPARHGGRSMSLAVVHSRAQDGVAAPAVTVEVHLSGGLPGTSIVGLPEAAVKEARDRVRVAIQNAQIEYPARRVTVSLAPADLPKDGGRFDLPIALGILAAAGHVPKEALARYEFLGELALSGELRAVTGVLPAALKTAHAGRGLIVPRLNAAEAALVSAADVRGADTLLDVLAFLRGVGDLPDAVPTLSEGLDEHDYPDLADVRGQTQARRALEIAAAGAHHLLFVGPPGTGKTMLASRLPGILPPLGEAEALESAAVRSVAGQCINFHKWKLRPFRSPHHTASAVALVGCQFSKSMRLHKRECDRFRRNQNGNRLITDISERPSCLISKVFIFGVTSESRKSKPASSRSRGNQN